MNKQPAACILANKREAVGKEGDRLLLEYASVLGESGLSLFQPCSSRICMEQLLDWIPAFAGMTVHTNNRKLQSYGR